MRQGAFPSHPPEIKIMNAIEVAQRFQKDSPGADKEAKVAQMKFISHELTSDKIMQLGLGFWGSKTFLSAIELGVFTELAKGPQDGESLRSRLDLHPRSARDFFDALVSLGMLERNNDQYANTPETDLFLDRAKPSYVGGILEMCNARLYGFWGNLTTGLKTGEPQNEVRRGEDFFAAIYADPARLKQFLCAMTGLSMGIAKALALKFLGPITKILWTSAVLKVVYRSRSRWLIHTSLAATSTCPSSGRSLRNMSSRSDWKIDSPFIQATFSRTRCRAPT